MRSLAWASVARPRLTLASSVSLMRATPLSSASCVVSTMVSGKAGVEEREPDAGSHGAGAEDADRLDVAQLACRGRCRAGSPPAARRRTRTAARGHRGWRPPRGRARARARCPRPAAAWLPPRPHRWRPSARSGPLGWRASEAARLLEQAGRNLVDLLLADAARRLAHLLLGEGDGGRDHVAVGQLVDQAGGGALGGVDEGARGDELQGLLHADRARQALRAAGARDDAELDLGQARAGARPWSTTR